jgi:iron complex outermembrane recepter protein
MTIQSRTAVRAAVSFALAASFSCLDSRAAENEGGLEEVVVTAQFREEKLQQTPIAISAFTAENMEQRGVANVTDLDAFVPNAVIQPLGAGWGATLAAFIRGVGLGDNILSFEPGVPIYVDDVYMGRPQGSIFDLLDLERVEVLRGPQGTLFGKNAVGGTVRLISKKPQGDGTGTLSLTVGNFNRIDARGSADVSLIPDRVYARFSFSSKKADGYFKLLDYECVNGAGSLGAGGPGALGIPGIRLGSQIAPGTPGCVADTAGNENVQSARAAFRFLLNDAAEFNLIGDVTSQRQKGPADKYTVMDPNGGFFTPGWNASVAAPVFGAGVGYDARFLTKDFYSSYGRFDDPIFHRVYPNINDLQHWGVAGTLEWKLSDHVSLKSVTAYRTFWNTFGRDSDGSPLPIDATYDDNRHRQFTEEVTLTGTAGRLDWATGAFYYDAHDSNRGYNMLYTPFINAQDSFDRQDTKNWALFAQGTWHVTDPLSVTLGGRYTDDQKDATISRIEFNGTPDIDNQFVPTSATNTDYTVSLDYQWNPDVMTYAKFATGFKGGGFSPRPSNPLQTAPFKPEKLKTLEIGAKTELLEHRVRLNGAWFYSKYTDQQTFAQQFDSSGANWFRTFNAGKARIWGLEGEIQAEPVDHLRIEGSFGYVNYELTDNEGNTLLFEGDTCGVNADERCYSPRTPKYNGAIGVSYGFAMAGGTLTPRLDAVYTSKIYYATNNGGEQDAYTLLNGRIAWENASRDWEFSVYGQNLTNEEYFNGKLSLIGFFGREQGNPGPPRQYGVTFRRSFR